MVWVPASAGSFSGYGWLWGIPLAVCGGVGEFSDCGSWVASLCLDASLVLVSGAISSGGWDGMRVRFCGKGHVEVVGAGLDWCGATSGVARLRGTLGAGFGEGR